METPSRIGKQLLETGQGELKHTQMKSEDLTKGTSTLTPLSVSLITDKPFPISPAQAWHEGTNILKAMRDSPAMIRGWIMAEVGQLIKELDTKTTISSDEELIFCCNSIVEEHPTLKVEEIRTCFNMIRKGKFGKLYERLKTPEILECLRRYEGEVRVEILERKMHDDRFKNQRATEKAIGDSGLREVVDKMVFEPVESKGEGVGTRLRGQLGNNLPD